MPFESHFEQLLLAALLVKFLHNLRVKYRSAREKRKKKKGPPRSWRPKNPKERPACQMGVCLPALFHPRREVKPWKEVKSQRGRKKEIDIQGQCCLNPRCVYFGIIDAAIHALVGNGKDGVHQDIQLLKCQCCGKRFSSRRNTPLYYLKTATIA